MYTFARIHRKGTKDYGTWYFFPKSIEDIDEHWTTICRSHMKSSIEKHCHDIFSYGRLTYHPFEDSFESAVQLYMDILNRSYAESIVNIENEAYRTRIESYFRGDTIYLANGMQVLMMDERFFEIAETQDCENLVYPTKKTWSLDDVRYMQWSMLGNKGEHWYAKIGTYDIRDEYGNMKWNTKAEAETAAEWFLKNKMKQ